MVKIGVMPKLKLVSQEGITWLLLSNKDQVGSSTSHSNTACSPSPSFLRSALSGRILAVGQVWADRLL
eukprot:5901849-Amphidinium_carterae.1